MSETPGSTLNSIFDAKYFEFAVDLRGALPELESQVQASLGILKTERRKAFIDSALRIGGLGSYGAARGEGQ